MRVVSQLYKIWVGCLSTKARTTGANANTTPAPLAVTHQDCSHTSVDVLAQPVERWTLCCIECRSCVQLVILRSAKASGKASLAPSFDLAHRQLAGGTLSGCCCRLSGRAHSHRKPRIDGSHMRDLESLRNWLFALACSTLPTCLNMSRCSVQETCDDACGDGQYTYDSSTSPSWPTGMQPSLHTPQACCWQTDAANWPACMQHKLPPATRQSCLS